jgi:2-keto-4-pentenoate hydratase
MDVEKIKRAAAALVQARQHMNPLAGLPAGTSPSGTAEAHAIQDETTLQLGKTIAAYKAMAPANGDATRGLIYAGTVVASPATLPVAQVPQCGVEGEVAFLLRKDLPRRGTPYTREEVAAAIDAVPVIEVVHSRFAVDAPVSPLDKLADSISNGALVFGQPKADWRGLELGKLIVTLEVNGARALQQEGGHPIGDPLEVVVVLANMLRETTGLKSGEYVTCGSYTGLRYLTPGDTCTVRFEGLGDAEVVFQP